MAIFVSVVKLQQLYKKFFSGEINILFFIYIQYKQTIHLTNKGEKMKKLLTTSAIVALVGSSVSAIADTTIKGSIEQTMISTSYDAAGATAGSYCYRTRN